MLKCGYYKCAAHLMEARRRVAPGKGHNPPLHLSDHEECCMSMDVRDQWGKSQYWKSCQYLLLLLPGLPSKRSTNRSVPQNFLGLSFFSWHKSGRTKLHGSSRAKKKKKRTRDVGPKLGHVLHTQNSDYERTIEMESDPHCAKQYRSGTWDRVQGFLWPQGLCFLLWHGQSLSAVLLNRSCGETH